MSLQRTAHSVGLAAMIAFALAAFAACPQDTCEVNADCAADEVCGEIDGQRECIAPGDRTDAGDGDIDAGQSMLDAGRDVTDAGTPADGGGAVVDAGGRDGGTIAQTYSANAIGLVGGGMHGMAVADDGRLFISDTFGNVSLVRQVYVLNAPYDGLMASTGITGAQPAGLLYEDGTLFVADVLANTVTAYDDVNYAAGDVYTAEQPWNVVRASDGTLVTTTFSDKLQRLDVFGAPTTIVSGLDAPFDLVANADGSFWVTEQGALGAGRVTRRGNDGDVVEEITDRAWDNPEGITVGPGGAIFIADTGAGDIVRVANNMSTSVATFLAVPILIRTTPAERMVFNLAGGALFALDADENSD